MSRDRRGPERRAATHTCKDFQSVGNETWADLRLRVRVRTRTGTALEIAIRDAESGAPHRSKDMALRPKASPWRPQREVRGSMVHPVGRIAKMHARRDRSKRDGGQITRSMRAGNLARSERSRRPKRSARLSAAGGLSPTK